MQAVSKFTYTLETIIQAGKLLVAVEHVPVRTNPKTRESRLFPSTAAYVRRNALSIFRIYSQYQPLKVFWGGALVMGHRGAGGVHPLPRLLRREPARPRPGHIQSLIAGAVLFNAAMLLGALGVIGDLLDAQRTLSQRTFERVRRIELQLGVEPSHYEPGRRPRPAPPARTGSSAVSLRGRERRTARRSRYERRRRRQRVSAVPTGNTFDKYGSTNPVVRRLMAGFEGDARRAVRARAGAGVSVLDVGCGEGVLTDEWARRLGDRPGRRDRPRRTRSSRPSGARAARANLEFRGGAAQRSCPFADDEFDLVAAIEALEHVPDPERTLAEMARVAASPPARVGPARAAVAGAQRRPRRVRARARATPRATSTTGPSAASCGCSRATARWSRSARRSPGRCVLVRVA